MLDMRRSTALLDWVAALRARGVACPAAGARLSRCFSWTSAQRSSCTAWQRTRWPQSCRRCCRLLQAVTRQLYCRYKLAEGRCQLAELNKERSTADAEPAFRWTIADWASKGGLVSPKFSIGGVHSWRLLCDPFYQDPRERNMHVCLFLFAPPCHVRSTWLRVKLILVHPSDRSKTIVCTGTTRGPFLFFSCRLVERPWTLWPTARSRWS